MDTFKAIVWNVYAGSRPEALEPHLIREKKHGVSVFLMSEAGSKGITPMITSHGLGTFNHGQWRIAWDPKVWPGVVDMQGVRLAETEYFSPNKQEWISTECAVGTLVDTQDRSLKVLSYHTPPHVQVREAHQGRELNRVQTTREAFIKIGHMAQQGDADGFLCGGDDNWDEDSGWQQPKRLVRNILLGRKTGLRQLQAEKPTFGKREIDDFRIIRDGPIIPVGPPWVHEGGGQERPNHKIHGRRFGWRK